MALAVRSLRRYVAGRAAAHAPMLPPELVRVGAALAVERVGGVGLVFEPALSEGVIPPGVQAPADRQWAWFESELATARAKGQIVYIVGHHPPVGQDSGNDVDDLWPMYVLRVFAPQSIPRIGCVSS